MKNRDDFLIGAGVGIAASAAGLTINELAWWFFTLGLIIALQTAGRAK